ncbi:chromodomain-helicase-DNA-binding protein 1-like isoform X1, partial [Tachysurus ichikawai]
MIYHVYIHHVRLLPQAISLMVYARGRLLTKGPFLVLCPLVAIDNWKNELKRTPELQIQKHNFCAFDFRGHKVLLFSQMIRMLDILQDYLAYRSYTYERLDGSARAEERSLAIKNFRDEDTFIFLVSTRDGGVSLNLMEADTVIFYDSDYNPQNDLQAESRAHRIGQTRPVKVFRLLGMDTVEEDIYSHANAKLKLYKAVIKSGLFPLPRD